MVPLNALLHQDVMFEQFISAFFLQVSASTLFRA
jgi:hypothetical protein